MRFGVRPQRNVQLCLLFCAYVSCRYCVDDLQQVTDLPSLLWPPGCVWLVQRQNSYSWRSRLVVAVRGEGGVESGSNSLPVAPCGRLLQVNSMIRRHDAWSRERLLKLEGRGAVTGRFLVYWWYISCKSLTSANGKHSGALRQVGPGVVRILLLLRVSAPGPAEWARRARPPSHCLRASTEVEFRAALVTRVVYVIKLTRLPLLAGRGTTSSARHCCLTAALKP
jgi:hypothetical protein